SIRLRSVLISGEGLDGLPCFGIGFGIAHRGEERGARFPKRPPYSSKLINVMHPAQVVFQLILGNRDGTLRTKARPFAVELVEALRDSRWRYAELRETLARANFVVAIVHRTERIEPATHDRC